MKSGWLTHGPKNREFEEAFADYLGVDHAISMNSCASALHAAIQCQDIKGEVIVPSYTWVASINAIITSGAIPVLADVEPDTCNISPSAIEALITPQTEGIMPVHYAGQSADMQSIMKIADKHKLAVIEDAAEDIGGQHDGKMAGSFGAGCFSFFPTKNMTTGEGGMLSTNDAELARKARCLIGHGIDKSTYDRESEQRPWFRGAAMVGYNFRLTNFQAAMGLVQLKKLDSMNDKRRVIAAAYKDFLKDQTDIILPVEKPENKHVYQMFTIQVKDKSIRDELVNYLRDQGVGASVHFSPAVHQMKPFANIKCGDLTNTENITSQIITLPMYPDMSNADAEHVSKAIKDYFACR